MVGTGTRSYKTELEGQSDRNVSANVEGAIEANGFTGTVRGSVNGSAGSTKTTRHHYRQEHEVNTTETGVSVTCAGNVIHWDINSLWPRCDSILPPACDAYLSGELFQDPVTNNHLHACIVTWDSNASSNMEIHGVVRVMMRDLIMEDIQFHNNIGNVETWNTICKLSSEDITPGIIARVILDREQFKRRLLHQIIRKHLISQGMLLNGANIEICSAWG